MECGLIFIVFEYSQLTDGCLSATTASCPLIESLILMSCPSIGLDGLCSLRWLPNLTLLDLSYTFLVNLQPVFESCSQLKVRVTIYFHAHLYFCDMLQISVVVECHPPSSHPRKVQPVLVRKIILVTPDELQCTCPCVSLVFDF